MPSELEAPSSSELAILRFRGPVVESWRAQVTEAGATFYEYLPTHAFVVRIPAAARATVESFPFVLGVSPYHPGFKLHEDLGGDGPVEAYFFSAPSANQEDFRSLLASNGVQTDSDFVRDGILVVRGRTHSSALTEIAHSDLVLWIESAPISQSADIDRATRLTLSGWNKTRNDTIQSKWNNINGSTQKVGFCDTVIGNIADTTTYPGRTVIKFPHVAFNDGGLANPIIEFNAYHQSTPLTLPAHRKFVAFYEPQRYGVLNYTTNPGPHGTRVAGIIAGDAPPFGTRDDYDGIAHAARLVGCDKEDGTAVNDYHPYFYPTWHYGANISSHSYGVNPQSGVYLEAAKQQDSFAWNHSEFVIARSMGNLATPGTMRREAAAKNVIAVGATENYPWIPGFGDTYAASQGDTEKLWASSNRGPAADGRIKPNVVAPGACVNAPTTGTPGVMNVTDIDCSAGTSYATPAVAAAAALIRDYFAKGYYPGGVANSSNSVNSVSSALVRGMLQVSGRDIVRDTHTAFPNGDVGWGRVLLDDVLYFSGEALKLKAIDETTGISTGQQWTTTFNVANSTTKLRVMLVWTDYPGTVGALKALVNDLDLKVTYGTGIGQKVFVGNNFNPGGNTTLIGTALADRLNVEEAVYVPENHVVTGTWTVTVTAHDVPQGQNGKQPFSVVVVGELS